MVAKVVNFVRRDIWRIPVRKMKGPHGYFLRVLRILVLSFREFANDKCSLWASALTFWSLLSIVPVFAMAFGVAKGFGFDKLLKEKIIESAQGQQEVMTRIAEFSENMLANTKGGVIAGIGLVLLFWSVIKVLTNIEQAFNHIWWIKKERTLGQKFTDYMALMLIAPVFFIAASSASVFLVSQIENIMHSARFLGAVAPLIVTALGIVPFLVFAGLLTYIYIFMPNGKIKFTSALIGGITAGAIYQIVQWAYVKFQIGASNAGAVYGTFAALPLFLAWLQTSWLIVLYGAELSFAHQNEIRFEYEQESVTTSYAFRKLIALRVMQVYARRFADGLPPLSAEDMAEHLEMPIRLTQEVLDMLVRASLVNVVQGSSEKYWHYQPALDINELRIQTVLERIENTGGADVPVAETRELQQLRESLEAFQQTLRQLPENVLLKDVSAAPVKITESKLRH